MQFAGIDIGKEAHTLAVLDEAERVVVRPTVCREDGAGYARRREALGPPEEVMVVMEATGHYWQNLCAVLVAEGLAVAVLNPLRTHRFAGEDLPRAKTDALDAVALARFAVQKRPAPTRLPDVATRELRELVRLRDRWVAAQATLLRQLHRVVDLGFPEFTQHVRTLDSALATTLLQAYPTAAAFRAATPGRVAALCYAGRHRVGRALADALRAAAATSVGQHHSAAYQLQVRTLCEDLVVLWRRLRALEADIARTLDTHEVGRLLTTIDGIGPQTAARLLGELGDPAAFRDAAALASYVGVVPATTQSGKWHRARAGLAPIGHARLRAALWMPMLIAVRRNAWLRAFYERLLARGKPKKVALIAAMRKMLAAIYSVARSRQPFVPRLAAPEVSA
jgi:transposase